MTKKLISIFVATIMVLSLIPAAAFAGEAAKLSSPATEKSSPATEKSVAFWNFETNPVDDGWQLVDADGDNRTWFWTSLDDFAHSGSYSLRSDSYSGGALTPDNWAISPEFTVPEGETLMTFYTKNYSGYYQEKYSVYVINTALEVHEVALDETVAGSDWNEMSYDISYFSGDTVSVAIRHFNVTDMWAFFVDDVLIDAPRDPNVIYEADVSGFPQKLFDNQTPAELTAALSIPESADYSITAAMLTETDGTILAPDAELAEGETYVLQARLVPAEGKSFSPEAELTANSGGIETDTVFTGVFDTCDLASIAVAYECKSAPTFIWDFETDPAEQGFTFLDQDGDGYNWYWYVNTGVGNYSAHSGDGVAASESYHNDTHEVLTPDNWMITPEFTGSWLSFWMIAQDAGYYNDYIGIYVSTDGGETWSDELFGRITPTTYTQFEIDLSDYAGETLNVALRHYDSSDMFIAVIDDIEVGGEAQPEPIVIDTVEILGFVAPAWGEAPFYDVTVPEGAHYSIVDVVWYFFFEEEYGFGRIETMTPEMIFDNPNYEYYMEVQLRAEEGCTFRNDSITVIFNEYEGSGVAAGTVCYASTYRFTVEEPAPEPVIIDTVEILDFVAPVWGEHPFYDVTVPEGANYTIDYTDWNWWDEAIDDGYMMYPSDAFDNAGYAYYQYFEILPNEGCVFAENVTVTINGETAFVENGGYSSSMGYYWLYTIDFYVDAPEADIIGDIDLDGEVTTADALLALRYVLGLVELDEEQLAQADVDGDGEVTMIDSLLIHRRAMGVIESFPAENP